MLLKYKSNKNLKKTYKKTYKKTKKNKLYKQNGASFLNNISGSIFTNTQSKPKSYKYSQSINQYDIITIIYNRNSDKTVVINNTSPNILYQSSFVQTVPNIQMKDYNNHYLLVVILPGPKPRLLWAIEIKSGAKTKSILDYSLPRFQIDFRFKILFKLYKYYKNVKETFKVSNNLTKERHTVFNELKSYLTKNNMLRTSFYKEVNIIQDKGQDISQLLNFLAK